MNAETAPPDCDFKPQSRPVLRPDLFPGENASYEHCV